MALDHFQKVIKNFDLILQIDQKQALEDIFILAETQKFISNLSVEDFLYLKKSLSLLVKFNDFIKKFRSKATKLEKLFFDLLSILTTHKEPLLNLELEMIEAKEKIEQNNLYFASATLNSICGISTENQKCVNISENSLLKSSSRFADWKGKKIKHFTKEERIQILKELESRKKANIGRMFSIKSFANEKGITKSTVLRWLKKRY